MLRGPYLVRLITLVALASITLAACQPSAGGASSPRRSSQPFGTDTRPLGGQD